MRFDNSDPSRVMTLTRFMLEETRKNPDMQDFESLMGSIQLACKSINNLVMKAGMTNLLGLAGEVNIQGEDQKKLDVLSNDVLKNSLSYTGRCGVVASEEEEHPWLVEEAFQSKFVTVFDPLDGSSNVDAGIATGTIFGVFAEEEECLIPEEEANGMTINQIRERCLIRTLQPGSNLVAAGYCLYSSSCHLFVTFGNGVQGFTLDPEVGEFVLTHPDVKIPSRGKIYSFNEGNSPDWEEGLQKYVDDVKKGQGETGKKYTSRYIGSMVGDVHRTLLYGGIFGYPSDAKNKKGKLRLLYEAAPMSFLVEQAGGKSTTGSERILDLQPQTVHDRTPIILGSPEDVNECCKYLKE